MPPSTGQLWLLIKQCKRCTITVSKRDFLSIFIILSLTAHSWAWKHSTKLSALKVHLLVLERSAAQKMNHQGREVLKVLRLTEIVNIYGFMRTKLTQSDEEDCVIRSKASEQVSKWALGGDCVITFRKLLMAWCNTLYTAYPVFWSLPVLSV